MKKTTFKITADTKAVIYAQEVIYLEPKSLIPNKLIRVAYDSPENKDAYNDLKRSIQLFGITQPLKITKNGMILSGILRCQLPLSSSPTIS